MTDRAQSPFRYFNSSPEIIRLAVMMYVKYPLSLRNVEDLLYERGIDICHETVRHSILVNDSFEALVRAADALPPSVRGHFVSTLQRMLHQVARKRGASTFGTCTSCEHLEGDGCSREGQAPYACGFVSEPLLLKELDEICINFVPGKPMTVTGSVTGAAPR